MAMRLNLYFAKIYGFYFLATLGTVALGSFLITLGETFNRNLAHLNPSNLDFMMLAAFGTPDHLQKIMPLIVLLSAMACILHLARTQQLLIAQQTGSVLLHLFTAPILFVIAVGIISVALLNPLAAHLSERAESFVNDQLDQSQSLLSVANTGIWLRQNMADTRLIIHAKTFDTQKLSFNKISVFEYKNSQLIKRTEAKKALVNGTNWALQDVIVHHRDGYSERFPSLNVTTNIGPEKILDSFTSIKEISIWKLNSFISSVENAGFDAKEHIIQFHRLLSTPIVILAMFFLALSICARAHHRKLPHLLILSTIAVGFSYFVFLTTFQSMGVFHEWPIVFTVWLPHLLFLILVFSYILHQDSPNS